MIKKIISAKMLLNGSGISILDAARLIRNALDAMPKGSKSGLTPIQFCSKIIEVGKRHIRTSEMSIEGGFILYLKTKQHLRQESFSDIRYLGNRLLKSNPKFAARNFSELTLSECEEWLSSEFKTPSQFNKARAMLHGLFTFALRREWCDKNLVKLIEKRKVIEKEISPLPIASVKKLLQNSQRPQFRDCSAAVALLLLAGIRPREVRRLVWRDIDFAENSITIRSQCSKTGGIRQVEICPVLKKFLTNSRNQNTQFPDSIRRDNQKICPANFDRKWKIIRDYSGFAGVWVQDVLRHTFASYHAKRFRDMPRLQLNMGHRDLSLLRSRYVNMRGISASEANAFFHCLSRVSITSR